MPRTIACSMPLLMDLYELVMAQGYLESEMASWEGVFHAFYRRIPHHCSLVVSAGQPLFLDWLRACRFEEEHLEYLRSLRGVDGNALFKEEFLQRLRHLEWQLTIDAVPEGTLMLPKVPMMRVWGPLWQAQLVESALLNVLNFSSLVATYAAHLVRIAQGRPILEFGLRRAQGPNGALMASRAAMIGGCQATSNLAAGYLYDVPVFGTMAHSWVMAQGDEQAAFDLMTQLYPQGMILLIDTYDHRQGIQHAIQTAQALRKRGGSLRGVRIDSGDLHESAVFVRTALDQAGLSDVQIILSSDLDLVKVQKLMDQGTPCQAFGVGTALATAAHDPHLTGVYKLAAVRRSPNASWTPCSKHSDDIAKASIGGVLEPLRGRNPQGRWERDRLVMLSHLEEGPLRDQGSLFERMVHRGILTSTPGSVLEIQASVQRAMASLTDVMPDVEHPL